MTIFGTVIEQTVLYVPLALGAYIDIGLMKLPDLSLTSAFTFGAIVAAKALPFCQGIPEPLAAFVVILCAFAGGAVVGCVSSTLTQRAGFPHLLSAIITEGLFHGITQLVLGTSNSSLTSYTNPLTTKLLPSYPELPIVCIISTTLLILVYVLLKTPLGISFSIYGQNSRFFKHHRVSLPYIFTLGVMISNGLAGVAGYCFAQSNGFVDCSMGVGIPLFAITALLLGTVFKKQISLSGTVGGLTLYFVLQQLLLRVGFNLNYFTCVQSCLLLVILIARKKDQQIFSTTGL